MGGGGNHNKGDIPDGQRPHPVRNPHPGSLVFSNYFHCGLPNGVSRGGVRGVGEAAHLLATIMVAHYPIEGDDRPHGIGADLGAGRGRQVFERRFGNDGIDDHTRVGGNIVGVR